MSYYIFIKNNKLNGCGKARILGSDTRNIAVDSELYSDFQENPAKYIWNEATQNIVLNPDYLNILANNKRIELVEYVYELKVAKAYGGVILNNELIFGTKKSEMGSVVATLGLMNDTEVINWKFYTLQGFPRNVVLNKMQLAQIATFGRAMIDTCFAIEGDANTILENALTEELLNESWCEELKANTKTSMNLVPNNITIEFNEGA